MHECLIYRDSFGLAAYEDYDNRDALEEVKVEQPDNKDEDATDGVAASEKEKLVEGNKDDDTASQKSEKKDAEKEEEAAAAPSAGGGRGAAILESLRNVASQVPSMFKNKQKEKTKVKVKYFRISFFYCNKILYKL